MRIKKGHGRVERREQNQCKGLAQYFLECYENQKKIDEAELKRLKKNEAGVKFHANLFGQYTPTDAQLLFHALGGELKREDQTQAHYLEAENKVLRAQLESLMARAPNPMIQYASFLNEYVKPDMEMVKEQKPRKIVL